MLVLTRKEDETIDMTVPPSSEPTKIQVKVVRIKGNTTRLGVDAPREVHIKRGELQEDEAASFHKETPENES